jgi:hypothetical protein
LLTALGLAQARGQLVDALLDALAVLIQLAACLGSRGLFYKSRRLRFVQHFSSTVLPNGYSGRTLVLAYFKFQLVVHAFAPLHVQNIFRTVYDSQHFVVVQQTNLTAVDWDARARISAEDDPVTCLAPRAGGELGLPSA